MSCDHRTGSRVAARAVARSFGSVRWAFSGWGWTSGSGSARTAGSKSGETAEGQELHPDLAGRRAVAHRHVRPQAERGGRRPGRVQADRHLGPGPADQRGVPQPGQGHGPGDADPEHDLARVRPRPGRPPPADGLSPVAGPGVSGLRQRRRQGARGDAGDAAAVCRGSRRPDLRLERLSDARPTTRSPSPAIPTRRASGSRT